MLWNTYMYVHIVFIIGASLSKPHTNESLTVVVYVCLRDCLCGLVTHIPEMFNLNVQTGTIL